MPEAWEQILDNWTTTAKGQWETWHNDQRTRQTDSESAFASTISFVRALDQRLKDTLGEAAGAETGPVTLEPGANNAKLNVRIYSAIGSKNFTLLRDGDTISYAGDHWNLRDGALAQRILSDARGVLLPPQPSTARAYRTLR
ncbi:hypothetical protein JCM16408A_07370 [Methylobacterium phyllosphaerae]